jgi:hypothetical protein
MRNPYADMFLGSSSMSMLNSNKIRHTETVYCAKMQFKDSISAISGVGGMGHFWKILEISIFSKNMVN